jgi:uncharacterized coiled-coil protein SlyX
MTDDERTERITELEDELAEVRAERDRLQAELDRLCEDHHYDRIAARRWAS